MTSMIAPFALVLTLACAASQPPVPTPPKASQKQQQASPSKEQTASPNSDEVSSAPSVPALPVAPQSQPKPAQQSYQGNNETSEDWRIVLFTFMLTLVAIAQFFAMLRQSRHMRDGLVETRKATKATIDNARAAQTSADAAKKSADVAERTLSVAQRAVVTKGDTKVFPSTIHVATGTTRMATVAVAYVNSGPTPAVDVINKLFVHLSDAPPTAEDMLPTHPPIDVSFIAAHRELGASVNGPESSFFSFPLEPPFTHTHVGGRNTYVFGWIAYRDIFGKPHVTQYADSLDAIESFTENGVLKFRWIWRAVPGLYALDEGCSNFDAIVAMLPPRPTDEQGNRQQS
jgi:hypothetical protein